MDDIFFDKSEKGKEELATRKYQLPSKLRPLLVIIDGKQASSVVLKKVAGLGLTEDSLAILLEQGFIVQKAVEPAISSDVKSVAPTPKKRVLCTPTPERTVAIRHFFNETIKSKLGLRGFGLQLKTERAESIVDFLELGETLIESIQKSKGAEVAGLTQVELDSLLYDFVD
jgi:hypothetical protein